MKVFWLFILLVTSQFAGAATFGLFNSKYQTLAATAALPSSAIQHLVENSIDTSFYREIKAQVIYKSDLQPDHLLVFLLSQTKHTVAVARINVDSHFKKISVVENYELDAEDLAQQPGLPLDSAICSDPQIEFVVFSPNRNRIEQRISQLVARRAEAAHLKVVSYFGRKATRQNFLNAMACPLLKGTFFDGDGSAGLIVTSDGAITVFDVRKFLEKKFRFKVINIWVSCNTFKEPMKTAMLLNAQSQKFAAGMNDLDVGASDYTAACAMIAAINGKPVTAAFKDCYKQYDNPEDQWGIDGYGSEYFGV